MKLESLVIPLDGSRFAEAALPFGTVLARRHSARLRLVLSHATIPDQAPGEAAVVAMVALQEQERDYLGSIVARIDPAGVLHPELCLLTGQPGPTLAADLERHHDDLVIMATHGRGAISRLWLGSVADYLVRHVHAPLLLVRPRTEDQPVGEVRIDRVLVPLDTSTASEQILDPVLEVAETGAEITLVHVVEPVLGVSEPALPFPMPMDAKLVDELRTMAQARLDRVAERLRARGRTVRTRVLTGLGAAVVILDEAAAGNYGLIAMTTHGEGGLRRLLVGSVADKVIRGADRPVLVLRPGGVL
jgi:nucleotide-binding universal stress UspA family protein